MIPTIANSGKKVLSAKNINPFTTEARFYVLNAIAFST